MVPKVDSILTDARNLVKEMFQHRCDDARCGIFLEDLGRDRRWRRRNDRTENRYNDERKMNKISQDVARSFRLEARRLKVIEDERRYIHEVKKNKIRKEVVIQEATEVALYRHSVWLNNPLARPRAHPERIESRALLWMENNRLGLEDSYDVD